MATIKQDTKKPNSYTVRDVQSYERLVVLDLGEIGDLLKGLAFLELAATQSSHSFFDVSSAERLITKMKRLAMTDAERTAHLQSMPTE